MPSVLGVQEKRERVALARADELRAEVERLQAALAEADNAARRAIAPVPSCASGKPKDLLVPTESSLRG